MPSYEKRCLYVRSFGELIPEKVNTSLSHQRLHPVIKEYLKLRKFCKKNYVVARASSLRSKAHKALENILVEILIEDVELNTVE